MVKIYQTATAPFNLPGTPVSEHISLQEAWAVLVSKCRNPVGFVDVIEGCHLSYEINDKNGDLERVTRHVKIFGVQEEIVEMASLRKPFTIIFEAPSINSVIHNILSLSPDSAAEPTQLYLTFTADVDFPDLKEGDEEYSKHLAMYRSLANTTVANTVRNARKLKAGGYISK